VITGLRGREINSTASFGFRLVRRFDFFFIGSKFVDRQFKFEKRSQLFIRVHNVTLSIVAMRVNNPDRSPVGIHG
jgi:hypothetical protein